MREKPSVFIGSSVEGREIAECVQQELGDEVEATGWWQGVFGLSENTMESLADRAKDFDFAILVVTPDDPTEKRGRPYTLARDNVVLEIGLFIGALGRKRTFVIRDRDESLGVPSDLAGTTVALFSRRDDQNLRAAVGPACTEIKTAIRRALLGAAAAPAPAVRPSRSSTYVARRRRRRSLGTARAIVPTRTLHIENISVTGALLETDGEIPRGQVLDLDLELDNGTSVRVKAEVVRVQYPAWGLTPGVGVRFTSYDGPALELIERYVNADPSSSQGSVAL